MKFAPPRRPDGLASRGNTDVTVAAVALIAVVVAFAIKEPEPMPPTVAVTAAVTQIIQGTNAPIASYDPREQTLTINPEAPRATLVCLRGTCLLAEQWAALVHEGPR